jgi:signal peptidase I
VKKKESPFSKIFTWQKIKRTVKEYGKLGLILFIVTSSLIQGSRVPTPSMETTIMTGDFLMVNKLAYDLTTPRNIPFTDIELPFTQLLRWNNPDRGDIVVFQFPGNRDEIKNSKIDNYVKRCVAVAGDTLEVRDKILYVNGKEAPIPIHVQYARNYLLPKDHLDADLFPRGTQSNADQYGPIVVPKSGDIINLSTSNIEQWKTFINREYGKDVVKIENKKIFIDGKETTQYKVHDDYYFMMGDNRDNSLDSRYWGFVPRRNVIGSPLFVYWSWNSDIPFSDFFNLIASVRLDRIGKIVY